jgi:hypothetical protein
MSVPETLSYLSPNVARHTLYVLTSLLPAPLTDLPEERAARDQAAIDAVAALKPADAFEAMLAARIVGANAHALDCLRGIGTLGQDSGAAEQCWSRAGLMTRLADAALRILERRQKARAKAEAAPSLNEDAAAPLASGIEAEADQYALEHRKRATLIRRLGRTPEKVDWGPLKPELVRQIVTGDTPILRSLETRQGNPRFALAA